MLIKGINSHTSACTQTLCMSPFPYICRHTSADHFCPLLTAKRTAAAQRRYRLLWLPYPKVSLLKKTYKWLILGPWKNTRKKRKLKYLNKSMIYSIDYSIEICCWEMMLSLRDRQAAHKLIWEINLKKEKSEDTF